MSQMEFPTFDRYEEFLSGTLRTWTPPHRVAFAAAMAERWSPAYLAFSKAERWGDPAALRRALDAAWACAGGAPLSRDDERRLTRAIDAVTPHMDDFDAPEALCAAAAATYALRASAKADNIDDAMQAALSGFHGVEPEWDMDEDETPALWRRAAVRAELGKQLVVLSRVEAIDPLDATALAGLRAGLADPEVAGRVPKPARTPAGPPAHANEVIWDIHRNRTRSGLERPNDLSAAIGFEQWVVLEWLIRYSLRKQALSGANGRLADATGVAALVARNRARDAAATQTPGWSSDLLEHVEMLYANRHNPAIEVRSWDAPHGYGPSVRQLWVNAVQAGASHREAWEQVLAWARHRPAAWERTNARRSKQARAAYEAGVGARAGRSVVWQGTGDLESPWAAEVDGERWMIRLGDFPEEPMYRLEVDGAEVGELHDWPQGWTRD